MTKQRGFWYISNEKKNPSKQKTNKNSRIRTYVLKKIGFVAVLIIRPTLSRLGNEVSERLSGVRHDWAGNYFSSEPGDDDSSLCTDLFMTEDKNREIIGLPWRYPGTTES